MTCKRHKLTDAQYEKIKRHLSPQNTGKKGRPSKDHRLILNGILWILATGAPWRDLPERFGSWKTIYWRFRKWQKEGLFETIFQMLTKDADMENLLIDSTCIKVHQSSNGGQKKGGPRRQQERQKEDSTPKSMRLQRRLGCR